jgi:hypothetical protein
MTFLVNNIQRHVGQRLCAFPVARGHRGLSDVPTAWSHTTIGAVPVAPTTRNQRLPWAAAELAGASILRCRVFGSNGMTEGASRVPKTFLTYGLNDTWRGDPPFADGVGGGAESASARRPVHGRRANEAFANQRSIRSRSRRGQPGRSGWTLRPRFPLACHYDHAGRSSAARPTSEPRLPRLRWNAVR